MTEPAKRPKEIPESYSPKDRPEILDLAESAIKKEQNQQLPAEFIIVPKEKIQQFSGNRWPYSNVEPAVYAALGLLYGRTKNRDDSGALINSDIEYSIHNVLTGHAFGLFYCLPDDSLCMAMYGITSSRLKKEDYPKEEIAAIVKEQIYRGNAVYIDDDRDPFHYLIWGYRDNGNILMGHKFEDGNDDINCSCDFENPTEFDSWPKVSNRITLFLPEDEQLARDVIYRRALVNGYRMLTQTEPPSEMDFERVHFGYGKAIYDEWIRQLEKANAENSEEFYFSSPIYPHFIALYENRLHLFKFMKIYSEMYGHGNLLEAAGLCEQLKTLAQEGAQIGFKNKWSEPKVLAMTNNERRDLLIDLLKKCHALETEIAGYIKVFIDEPESYSPKTKPEIVNMMEELTETAGNQTSKGDAEAMPEPRILKKAFTLIGVKENIGDVWPNFEPLLCDMYKTVNERLASIKGITKPARMIGYWFMDNLPSGKQEYCYFAGVEVDCINPPEGLTLKVLPESLYAVFTEQERGTIGGPEGYGYKKWLPSSSYELNKEIPGDFEIFTNMTDTGSECEAEILIPVRLADAQ